VEAAVALVEAAIMMTKEQLYRAHPEMRHPMYCENGCGAVIELTQGYRSYKRGPNGESLLICECCAAEIGHRDEDLEDHDEGPVCQRRPKVKLR
jgi:hypothetical protein